MFSYIFDLLPYKSSFRFVDEISYLDAERVVGHCTLKEDAFFYEDHFPGHPVTPGAILTEIMAQIGLVVLGIHLIVTLPPDCKRASPSDHLRPADLGAGPIAASPASAAAPASAGNVFPLLSSVNVDFHKMALPGQRLTVTSKKDYFRFDKLKCHVEMHNEAGELIAKGIFSGFIKKIETA